MELGSNSDVVDRPPRERRRLSSALSAFWEGGGGSSHSELTRIFDMFDVGDDGGGNKADRVRTAVLGVEDDELWELVDELLHSIRFVIADPPTEEPYASVVARDLASLREALQAYGRAVDDNGSLVHSTPLMLPEHARLPTVSALREHLARLQRSSAAEDPSAMIGSAKELVESTVKVVLHEVLGQDDPQGDLPQLAKEAEGALALRSNEVRDHANPKVAAATKRILGGLGNIPSAIAELRNEIGTGHGRATESRVPGRYAKLTVGAAITYCEMLLDTLQDPDAPWRQR